jgi:uncharacterized protein YqjF (DUF2071 family)
MHHCWRDLLFLHWEIPVEILQAKLPKGLTVDTFEGKAYIGLVPFRISNIRSRGYPAVPGFCQFPEINVRTYVHREGRDPGVWFFSLDAANMFACIGARLAYHLPYFFAEISSRDLSAPHEVLTEYRSKRYLPGPIPAFASIDYKVIGGATAASPIGTLNHFFVERYLLYSCHKGTIFVGQVHHTAYEVEPVLVNRLDENLIAAAGISRPKTDPLALFARRVDVDVFSLEIDKTPVVK